MYNESPLPSPDDVACYEECVTDEPYFPDSPTSPISSASAKGIPKSGSGGRISKKGKSKSKHLKERKCSSPRVLKWLEENYETVPGACLPRSVLYTHYQDYCKKNQMEPSSAASFGKIIRVKFPSLTTRRLGTRGQSKYHYYGLAIKETSIYYRSIYSKEGLTRFSGAGLKRENGQLYNPSSKTGLLLPEFPKISKTDFPSSFPVDKVDTFLMMYRAHCQRILDSVVRANFSEVQDFLIHFWQGMPTHILPILSCQATVDLVVICDFILYRTLCEVLVPATLQPLPDNLVEQLVAFSHNMAEWVFAALQDLPAALGIRKVQTSEMFGKSLRRQTALVQLAKGARSVLRNSEQVSDLMTDWRKIDFSSLSHLDAFPQHPTAMELIVEFGSELEQLFVKQPSLEVYFEWLDSVLQNRVSQPAELGVMGLVELSQEFLLTWNYFYTCVEKEMAQKHIDSFRVLHQSLDEYVNYVVEMLQSKAIERQYYDALKVHGKDGRKSTSDAPTLAPFPPTPNLTPNERGEHEFFYSTDHAITAEFQDMTSLFPTGVMQSPDFSSVSDNFYDTFFKHELANPRPSCLIPNSLPLEHHESISTFFDGSPLTPQSSYYSSNSPLSHASLQSPEPSCYDSSDQYLTGGSSPVNLYNASPIAKVSSPTSPDHLPACDTSAEDKCALDIAASLELIAENTASSVPISGHYNGAYGYNPIQNSPFPHCAPEFRHVGFTPFSPRADFELFQAIPNPDDLLVDPFCPAASKDVKPIIHSSPVTPLTPLTPIH